MNPKVVIVACGLFVAAVVFAYHLGASSVDDDQDIDTSPSTLSEEPSPSSRDSRRRAEPETPAVEQPASEAKDQAANSGALTRVPINSDVLFSPALLAHFRTKFLEAWTTKRSAAPAPDVIATGETDFRAAVLALPAHLGIAAAKKANDADAVARGIAEKDGQAILDGLQAGTWRPDPSTLDLDLMAGVLAKRTIGAEMNGSTFNSSTDTKAHDGLTLVFPEGVHELKPERLQKDHGQTLPSDLSISGAGIDATLLRIGEISGRSAMERLNIRDLTLDLQDNYFFDLRGKTDRLTIDLERVRIVRFDMGAGGSLCFGVNAGIILRARESEFLGGYGRSPGSGNLFRGSASWMYFDRCRFSRLDIGDASAGAVNYSHCRFEDMRVDPSTRTPDRFRSCTVSLLSDPSAYHNRDVIPLSRLFPILEGR